MKLGNLHDYIKMFIAHGNLAKKYSLLEIICRLEAIEYFYNISVALNPIKYKYNVRYYAQFYVHACNVGRPRI
jgi:hypothetical protein